MEKIPGAMPKLSVSELTSLIKTTLEGSFYGLTVEGEIWGLLYGDKDKRAPLSLLGRLFR